MTGGYLLSEEDLYLLNEGTHRRLASRLGAHLAPDGSGTSFAVWAPSAGRVSVVGDFNAWDPGAHPLGPRGGSGVWEGRVDGAHAGQVYKFAVTSADGRLLYKADPYALATEIPPRTGSVVWRLGHEWGDEAWMRDRGAKAALDAPLSIYEVHLGSWRRDPSSPDRLLSYGEIAPALAAHVSELGFSHVELLPVMEHPFYGSWGYQITGYFAPSARYGTPDDFMAFVDTLHQAGIGVIYGRHEVRSFLLSSAEHWLSTYHADGLRVDAVASMLYLDYSRKAGEWIPNREGGRENLDAISLLRQMNVAVYHDHPDVQTVAEESTAWPGVSRPTDSGGLGFGYKWDMGWMHDTLAYLARDPVHRRFHHDQLTFRGLYAFTENYVLPLSHDEVVHGKGSLLAKMPGDDRQKFAGLRLLLGYQWSLPGKKLLFMGGEFGQRAEWSHEGSLDWHLLDDPMHAGVARWTADLNRLYRDDPALHELDADPAGFEWVEADAASSTLAFLRRSKGGRTVLVACNFTPVPRPHTLLGVPYPGYWRELLNSDAEPYGGGGIGNLGGVEAQPVPWHDHARTVNVTLPPLGCVVLGCEAVTPRSSGVAR